MSEWQKANINIEHMRQMGIKSAQILAKGRKTKIERAVEEELIRRGISFKYNKILKDIGQFDFIINANILLEVQGDYWHANPEIYGDGPNLRPLNERQLYKVERDREKYRKAKELDYKVFYIWETEIKKHNFEVLDEIDKI